MIYNTGGRSNDTTETQKERRSVLMLVLEETDTVTVQYIVSKQIR